MRFELAKAPDKNLAAARNDLKEYIIQIRRTSKNKPRDEFFLAQFTDEPNQLEARL